MPKIFISYRRQDSKIIAHRIHEALAKVFGGENVFIDVDDIPFGTDFRDVLSKEIANSNVVLVLIGDKWAEIMRQRLQDQDDFVRFELISAIEQRKRVIPILLDNTPMPDPQVLPEQVRGIFPFLNAKSLDQTKYFHRDMEELIRALKKPQKRFLIASLALLVVLILLAALSYPVWLPFVMQASEMPSPTESPTENIDSTEATEAIEVATEIVTEAPSESPTTEASPIARGGGNQLVFTRGSANQNSGDEVYLIDLNSGDTMGSAITHDEYDDANPVWSPDGSKIAYESFRRNAWVIMIMNADGSEPRQLTASGIHSTQPHWSPDGETITFTRGTLGSREIFVQRLDETVARQVTNSDWDVFWPVWFSEDSIYFITDNQGENWLNRVNITGNQFEPLTSLGGNVTQFDISPDRSKIVYPLDSHTLNNSIHHDIFVMDALTHETINITNDTAIIHNYPAWSPDSSQIVYMTDRDGNNELYIMNADGSQSRRVTNTSLWEWTSSWRP